MVVGHSYLPNDRDFGSIETARKKAQNVYVPEDWCNLIATARHRNPLTVTRMKTSDFVSCKNLTSGFVNRKTTITKQKVEWLKDSS